MAAKKPTVVEQTKPVAKDTGLETVAIGAIPIGLGLIQAGEVVSGVAAAGIGVAALVVKYKLRD
jgi:hypothetical protein